MAKRETKASTTKKRSLTKTKEASASSTKKSTATQGRKRTDQTMSFDPIEAQSAEVNGVVEGDVKSQPATPSQPGPTEVLGQVVWLMMQSPSHKHLFMNDLEWLVVPPLLARQFRLFRQKGMPVGFASWAYLNDEADERMSNGTRKLQPGEWKSGEHLWLLDIIAPFGGSDRFVNELLNQFPGDAKMKALRPSPDEKGLQVVQLEAQSGTN